MNKLSASPTSLPAELIEEFRRHCYEWTQRAAALTVGGDLRAHLSALFTEVLDELPPPEQVDDLAHRIHKFIMANLHRGPTLKDLGEFLGYSEKYCSEFFRGRMGQSFSSYLRRIRVSRAKQLLLIAETSLADVGEALGFCDQFAFSHFFKKAVGCSPHHFRQRSKPKIKPILARRDRG